MKPDVSIIMPVYNSEEYLLQAAHSVLNQSYKNIELIMVDDGSTDKSGELCDELAKQDGRVKVIHKENGGICSARNVGLKIAKGKYIGFCDNDDEYMPNLIKDNYAYAVKYNADIVRYGRKRLFTKNGIVVEATMSKITDFKYISSEKFVDNYEHIRESSSAVWTGLYKSSFLKEKAIFFAESFKYGEEDVLFNLECYEHYPSMVLNPKMYYCWHQRLEHSTTGKFHENLIDSLLVCIKKEWEFVRRNSIDRIVPGLWQDLLINIYYSEVLARISPDICNNSSKEKRKFLSRLRNDTDVSYKSDFSDIKYLRKKGMLNVLAWILIKYRCVYLLYLLMNLKKKILRKL